MVETTRGITVKIPAGLHAQVKAEQEALELTMSQYIQQIIEEHFSRKEGKTMEATRTLAFQVGEELFQRVKRYLAAHPNLTQKAFIIGLVEEALAEFEALESTEAGVNAQEARKAQDEALAGESDETDGDGPDSAAEDEVDDTDGQGEPNDENDGQDVANDEDDNQDEPDDDGSQDEPDDDGSQDEPDDEDDSQDESDDADDSQNEPDDADTEEEAGLGEENA